MKKIYQIIMDQWQKKQGDIIFFGVSVSTGKVFFTNLILYESKFGKKYFIIASSGILVMLMEGWKTAHTGLKLSILVLIS